MLHPFVQLQPEYTALLSSMQITRPDAVNLMAHKALSYMDRYSPVAEVTGVPAALLAAIHLRESSFNFNTNLAQGDPLTGPSHHVPAGRPPLGPPPNDNWPVTWEYAAMDAIKYDHLDDLSIPAWNWPYVCWKGEAWNGFGPRAHGRRSGYLWSGTDKYIGGKYIADGVWDPNAFDSQLGIIPVMIKIVEFDPSLKFDDKTITGGGPLIPVPISGPPAGVGATDVRWMQTTLTGLGYGPLLVDGSYGRRTREAVRAFQVDHGLDADGLAGPVTLAAMHDALK